MNCPHCAHDSTKITETRTNADSIWRRRKCDACRKSFVSTETTEPGLVMPPELNRYYREKRTARLPAPLGTIESGFAGWRRP
jgi:transcriptional regulator NrdR family protein